MTEVLLGHLISSSPLRLPFLRCFLNLFGWIIGIGTNLWGGIFS